MLYPAIKFLPSLFLMMGQQFKKTCQFMQMHEQNLINSLRYGLELWQFDKKLDSNMKKTLFFCAFRTGWDTSSILSNDVICFYLFAYRSNGNHPFIQATTPLLPVEETPIASWKSAPNKLIDAPFATRFIKERH